MLNITNYLYKGINNAITGKELCARLNISNYSLLAQIREARRNGAPICATTQKQPRGYFLAEYRDEMQNYCKALQHRAGEIHKTRRACIEVINTLPEREDKQT